MPFFAFALGMYALGVLASLLAGKSHQANRIGPFCAVLGSATGLCGLVATWGAPAETFQAALHLPFGSLALRLDALSRFFLVPVYLLTPLCAVYGARYLASHEDSRNLGAHWAFLNLMAATMCLVLAVDDGFLFLMAWELMSLTPFFLVSFDDHKAEVREASWVYLAASHLGAIPLLVAMALLAGPAGSMAFDAMRAASPTLTPALTGGVFALFLLGFGAKAGLPPLHVWLPEAHPAAPSHVSALMSGALVNAGVYGLCRGLEFLGPVAAWQGPLLLVVGLAAGLYAILSALVQKDLKRLLALSTVENMGIAVIGLGAGLTALHAGLPTAAFLGLAGALLHVLGHSLFKGLLFLAAGSVLKGAGTAMLDRLGGLAKRMPATSFCFAAGSAAIAGLPPFNGFVGEFAIYLSLASGLTDGSGRAAMILGFAGLAAVGGLAMACFTRALGLAFLGAPRGPVVDNATESGPGMLLPMALLAVLCLAGGLGAPYFFSLAAPTAQAMLHGLGAPGVEPEALAGAMDTMTHIGLAGLALAILVPALALARRALPAAQRERRFRTWDCGYAEPTVRMQYSAHSFTHPLARVFGPATGLKAHLDPPQGLFPGKALLETRTPDLAREYFWTPVFEWTRRACDTLKWFQHGRLHIYILCLLATLVALLAWQLGGM